MSKQISKIYHAAIYVRLSKEDGDVSTNAKAESNSISNQKDFIRNFLADKKTLEQLKNMWMMVIPALILTVRLFRR